MEPNITGGPISWLRLSRWGSSQRRDKSGAKSADSAFWFGQAVVFEADALGGEQAELFGEGGAGFFALEAADGQIGRDDAVAGDLRGEGVGAEGLANGAG